MPQSTTLLENIARNIEITGVPGLALAIIENHRIESSHSIGIKNFETKAPVTENTIFHAASLSKPVFTYGVLSLQREGKLNLDQPLDSYLSLAESNEVPLLKQITARQVLTHTSGLQNWRIQANDKLEFAFAPGTDFSYSGEGFYYLQLVVEQLTGQSTELFLRDRVFGPFGMSDSSFIWREGYEALISLGHRNQVKKVEPEMMSNGPKLLEIARQKNKPLEQWLIAEHLGALAQINPAGTLLPVNVYPNVAFGMLTTANEYAQFMLRLLNPNDEIAKSMLTPQHTVGHNLFWGLGIGLEKINDTICFWHWGNMGIFTCFMFGNPATGNGAAIFTNDLHGLDIFEGILRELNGHELALFQWL